MNEKALRILEYDKIIEKLTEYAGSPMAKTLCRELSPSTDLAEIYRMQMETSDALTRIFAKGSISFSGLRDIKGSLLRLRVGSSLNIIELLHISSLLDVALRVKTYARKNNEDEPNDSLDDMFYALEPLSPLNNEIKRCIVSEDEIADDASAGLKAVRRNIKLTNDRIHSQLNTMVNSQSMNTKLQDNIITMRNGRYCLPVKAEYRSQVQGMIHDQSSTGSTLFIEPMAIVKLNNDLRELASKEKEEIDKILANLSNTCNEYSELLENNASILVALDFIFARASLSRSYNGTEPRFNENGYINIKKGRHPLLDKKKVVPIDISMGKDYRLLIVTGPNTGGKTVSLKTVGLFTLMGQSGLHIPAFDESELSGFEDVFADIGDEQSIEQSLSTFSSHMTNIVRIIQNANYRSLVLFDELCAGTDPTDYRSLVLFDELCAGTDPTEGAALAMAILKHMLNKQVTTMATTHYSELKVFALSTEGACNACCEFDMQTLSPTYRLLIGIPGKSNAFAISSKLGLPDFMIDEAKKYIDVSDQNFEDLIADLETSRSTIEKEQAEIQKYRTEIDQLKKKLEIKHDNLENQREKILREANEKAHNILQDAKDYADKTIRDMNKLASSGGVDNKALEKRRSGVRDKLNTVDKNLSRNAKPTASSKNKASDFKLGDSVKVLSLNLNGIITSKPNAKGEVAVQMGILKSYVSLKDLELRDEEVIKAPTLQRTGSGKIKMSKSTNISTSLNIIGQRVDEAIPAVDKYLDDAYLAHLSQVSIIHGRGTGRLKAAVHQKLKQSSHVKSYRLGEFGEGGDGVTIVEFK